MSKALVVQAPATLSVAEQKQMGAQLTAQFERARRAMLEIVTFGAMFLQVERNLCKLAQVSGGRGKKGGISEWLRTYAPSVDRRSAYRYRDISEALVAEFSLKGPEQLTALATETKLTPALEKKREKLVDLVADKSVRGLQLELGLSDPAPRGGAAATKSKDKDKGPTDEQRREAWRTAARDRAIGAFAELHTLDKRWQLLSDAELKVALDDLNAHASGIAAWLALDGGARHAAIAAQILEALQ